MNFIRIYQNHRTTLKNVNKLEEEHYGLTNLSALVSVYSIQFNYNDYAHLIDITDWLNPHSDSAGIPRIAIKKIVECR